MISTTVWKLAGTRSFRLASTAIFGYGDNQQNKNKSIREVYTSGGEGRSIVQVDQSGAEAFVLSRECRKGKFSQLFDLGIKSHVYLAMYIFSQYFSKAINMDHSTYEREFVYCPMDRLKLHPQWKQLEKLIKDHPIYYDVAKMVCHGSNYGLKGSGFALNVLKKSEGKIVLTVDEGNLYISKYESLFPEIVDWRKRTLIKAKQDRVLYNLFGQPLEITSNVETLTEDTAKDIYALVPQSTVGVLTSIALTALQYHIEDHHRDWWLLNNCHDSYATNTPDSEAITCASLMQQLLAVELTSSYGEKFRMKSEAMIGKNWRPYKKNINELGLKEI